MDHARDLVHLLIQMQSREIGLPLYLGNWNVDQNFLIKLFIILGANVVFLVQFSFTL